MIYIWVRETLDWEDEEAFLAQVPSDLRPKVALWNATFTIPFHLFRHRVRQIAKLNHSSVEGAVCADWDEIPEGALVLPVDDDDWFAPDVATVLKDVFDDAVAGYFWSSSSLEIPTHLGHTLYLIRRRVLPWTPPKWIFTTNNYALVKGAAAKPLFVSHVQASHWVQREAKSLGSVRRIDGQLSIFNRTLASQTTLRHRQPSLSRSVLLRKFRRYQKLYDRPTNLAWSRPYVQEMSDLMRELEVKPLR